MSGLKAKNVVGYVVMPGIIPRFKALFGSGFGYVAFLMAQVYGMVRLLPADHPYLNPKNKGRYSLRQVIAEAANHLVLDAKHIDQIAIFFVLLAGVVLLALQVGILILSLVLGAGTAMAGFYTPSSGYFATDNPTNDIAFMLMDRVFGVPDIFNSCVSTSEFCRDSLGGDIPGTDAAPFPWAFHLALHEFFRFYSTGVLLLATIIFLYYLVVIVAESATTGSPFGQRFQNVWVPVRLVVALGLLVPINYGLNAAQYITFYAAKYGSGLATTSWIAYNNGIYSHADFGDPAGMNPLGERETLIALPKVQSMSPLTEALSIVHTCAFTYYRYDITIKKGAGATSGSGSEGSPAPWPENAEQIESYMEVNRVKAYMLKAPADWMEEDEPTGILMTEDTTYQQAKDFFKGGDIIVTFGRLKKHPVIGEDGTPVLSPENIEPVCGKIKVTVADGRDSTGDEGSYPDETVPYLGAVAVQHEYFNFVRNSWTDTDISERFTDFAARFILFETAKNSSDAHPCLVGCDDTLEEAEGMPGCGGTAGSRPCETRPPDARWKRAQTNVIEEAIRPRLLEIWQAYVDSGAEFEMDSAVLERGWGGAGIWFNKIAHVNGAWMSAVTATPALIEYPLIMEATANARIKTTKNLSGVEVFNPDGHAESAGNIAVALGKYEHGENISALMYKLMHYWRGDMMDMEDMEKDVNGDVLKAAISMLFGAHGLFAMSENTHTHPLAQLTVLGRGLVEASIRNIAISTGSSVMGGIMQVFSRHGGPLVGAIGSLANSIAFTGLTAGLVLYYVVPFLPFVYFYFAVASWIKTIFEAMVGVPLWALAHMRLDGDGLPGDSASNGYFLILEIFLRPILTVVGLVAAMLIFTAQVRLLNFVWQLVIENVGAYDKSTMIGVGGLELFNRSVIDDLFFTITYAIIVYMMATAAFKLVDTIPDNILRWSGQGVSSFGDINQDPTGELTRYAALGGMTAGREVAKGMQQIGGGIGGAAGGLFSGRWGK